MPDLLAPANHEKLIEATALVFETMIPLPLKSLGTKDANQNPITGDVMAVLGYTGSNVGSFVISLSTKAATAITAALLMISVDQVRDADLCDAVGELANMIGGNFKNYLSECGLEVQLSSPQTIQGVSLQTKVPKKGVSGFSSKFTVDEEPFAITFLINSSETP